MRAKLRQLNGRPRNCKPINKKVLKGAYVNEEGIMTLPFTCKETESNGVEVVARGSFCPTYHNVEVLTKTTVAEWSDWEEWSECDCETESRSRSRECQGFGCPSETAVEVESCSDECLQCDDGYYAENNTVCVDVDECLEESACAENAACTNTEGSYDCECTEDASFGDGFNFCVTPGPCHPGGSNDDCSCDNEAPSYALNTYWNTTETSCKFEYTIAAPNITDPSGSWKLGLDFGVQGTVELWRGSVFAIDGSNFSIAPKSFNLAALNTDMTVHFETDGACDEIDQPEIQVEYCDSPYVAPPTTTLAATTPAPETIEATTAGIILGDEVCLDMDAQSSGQWDSPAEDGNTIRKIQMNLSLSLDADIVAYDWKILLNGSGEIVEMTTWNHEWDGLNTLVGKDYMGDYVSGHVSAGMILCTTEGEGFTVQPSFCFKPQI